MFVPPPFTWTGFYLGLNAGGIWGSGSVSSTLFANGFPILENEWPGGSLGGSQTGFIGGGQAGYNWQTGSFVLGVETDFDWTDLSSKQFLCWREFRRPRLPPKRLLDAEQLRGSLDWLCTTRVRVGGVVTPDNRLMIYGTGGFAYGGGSRHFDVFERQRLGLERRRRKRPAPAGPSAGAWKMQSPTRSRSRANICTTTSAARVGDHRQSVRRPNLAGHRRHSEDKLRRFDRPRGVSDKF